MEDKTISLYMLNQSLMEQQNTLTEEELLAGKELIIEFFKRSPNKYFMLLSHETRYYTIFNFLNKNKYNIISAGDEVMECLKNIGDTKSIEMVGDGSAVEIWVNSDVHFLFPYDMGVVEIGGSEKCRE